MPIINMVYKKKKWWKPWANTIAYYKFDWNLNDSSGNNHNLGSALYGTFNYTTTTQWAKYVYCSSAAYPSPISLPYKSDGYTINMWWKGQTGSNVILDFQPATSGVNYWNRIIYKSATSLSYVISRSDVTVPDLTTWKNICIVNSSNVSYLYINNSLITSQNLNSYNMNIPYFWFNRAGYAWSPQNTSWAMSMSELIIEDKARTAQEIADYYNQTKSNYWL